MKKKTLKIFLIFCTAIILNVNIANAQPILLPPDYLGFIQQRVNSYLMFPAEAKAKGWEGIVKVKFILVPDGRIKEIDVAESSGYPLLDAAAILAIKDASPYPFPEAYIEQDELEIILPITYTLPKAKAPAFQENPYLTFNQGSFASQEKIQEPAAAYQHIAIPIDKTDKKITPTYGLQEQLVLPNEVKENLSNSFSDEKLAQVPPVNKEYITTSEELTYFIDLAIKNNEPTKVAREEIELAQLKIMEAQRNFLPGLKLQGYTTDGEVYKVKYEEKEIKTQIDQPIYYSGRLTNTLKQAQANLEITQRNYDRLKFDVIQKTETGYYNLLASKMHLTQKEALRQEAQEILEKIEKLSAVGMVIPLEMNSAKSWFEQIEFQIKGIQQEILMAELTFKQVLNIKEAPPTKAQLPELKIIDLDLDTCLEVALKNRPEVYLSELLVKFNDYGKKIEKSKGGFSVDLTSSYSYYQGHYKTEPWRDADNWYAGFKVSKPWGASTLSTAYSSEETQPRFGQTSATASSTLSTEFNFLDNLRRFSDKRKSEIDLHRSVSDFDETFKTISFELEDAFLKYNRAISQINTAESEMKFRRNEAEVIKIRALVGETSLSNAIESLYGLSEAQSRYIQALANYYLSLATLKKACGYGIKI